MAQSDHFSMIFADAFGLFLLMQRHSGLNVRFDDSVRAQFDIPNDFSSFLSMIFVFLLMQYSVTVDGL